MALYAVGDIHGHLSKLDRLLDKISPQSDDELVFLGDYVDRGPDSVGVISRLIELNDGCRCVFLMGKHDHMFLDYIRGCQIWDPDLWKQNDGGTTLDSYGYPNANRGDVPVPSEHLKFLEDLERYYIKDGYVFVHAGLRPGCTAAETPWKDRLWIREPFVSCEEPWEEGVVVFGHTCFEEPLSKLNRIGLDTGCAYGGPLTAVELPEIRFIQV